MQKLKSVFLDAFTLNPGDNELSILNELLDLDIYPRTDYHQTIGRSKNAEVLIVNKATVDQYIIAALPKLRLIQVAATGYNNVDIVFARSKGIDVCNVSGYSSISVVQHVFALLLNYLNSVSTYADETREGIWSRSTDFSYWHRPIIELSGKNFGIIGFGKIGKAVAKLASAFGMNVLVSKRGNINSDLDRVSFHDQDYVFRNSDVLSLHAPLNDSTHELINKGSLSIMKDKLILINTSRGGLINESDLAEALKNDHIQAALLDVLSQEPPDIENVLIPLSNCYITPHQAWASLESRQRLLDLMCKNVQSFLAGNLINCVNHSS